MRIKYRVSLPWLAAAILAVALPATPSAWAVSNGNAAAQMLSSDLPAGLTLKTASVDQVGDSLYTAATQQPDMVMSLLEAAVRAKQPPPHHGEITCEDLRKLLKKATDAVPDKARQLFELAIALRPGCDDVLTKELDEAFGNAGGFGAGLGTNFPGSPGFTGSPPGGATALPPATNPQTTSVTGG
jgi:hypothetical protein